MGEKDFFTILLLLCQKLVQHTSFSPKFLCSIVGGTSDHSVNGFNQQGKLLILQLFHGLFLVFIGNILSLESILGLDHALKHSRRWALWDL
jgi:hypothetical protein